MGAGAGVMVEPAAAARPEADGGGTGATGAPLEEEDALVGAAEAPGGAAWALPLADGSAAGAPPPPGLAAACSIPMAVAGVGAAGAWGSASGLP